MDASVFRNIMSGKTSNEKLSLYNRAARNHGLIPVYMCLEKISPVSRKTYGYQYVNGRYVYKRVTIPTVIHNRSLPASGRMRKRLAQLTRSWQGHYQGYPQKRRTLEGAVPGKVCSCRKQAGRQKGERWYDWQRLSDSGNDPLSEVILG